MATYHGRVQINGSLTRGVLRLRQAMDTKSKVLAEMPDGTELDVTLTSGKTWFKTTYNGQTGYVRAVDIAITEGYPLYRVNVSKGTLNIRSVPKTGDNVVFTAAKDRGLYVLETSGDWYLFSCNIGTGWASKTYLLKDPSAVPFDYVTVDELIDAAGTVGLCARRPDGSDDLLHHLDVLVAAHRADHLRQALAVPPGTAPCPRRPGKNRPRRARRGTPPPVRRRPLDSGENRPRRARRAPVCPQGGIESLGCTGRRPRPPLVRIFAKFRGGGMAPKIKISRPFSDGCLHRKWSRASSRLPL